MPYPGENQTEIVQILATLPQDQWNQNLWTQCVVSTPKSRSSRVAASSTPTHYSIKTQSSSPQCSAQPRTNKTALQCNTCPTCKATTNRHGTNSHRDQSSSSHRSTDCCTTTCRRGMIASATAFSSWTGTSTSPWRTLRSCWGKRCRPYSWRTLHLWKSTSLTLSGAITPLTASMRTLGMSLISLPSLLTWSRSLRRPSPSLMKLKCSIKSLQIRSY